MSENEQSRQSRHSDFSVISWMTVATVLYFASLGPIQGLTNARIIPPKLSDQLAPVIYFPLWWLAQNTRFFTDNPIGISYVSYLDWW